MGKIDNSKLRINSFAITRIAKFSQRRANLDLRKNEGERRRYTNLKPVMSMRFEALVTWKCVCALRACILFGDVEIGCGLSRWD